MLLAVLGIVTGVTKRRCVALVYSVLLGVSALMWIGGAVFVATRPQRCVEGTHCHPTPPICVIVAVSVLSVAVHLLLAAVTCRMRRAVIAETAAAAVVQYVPVAVVLEEDAVKDDPLEVYDAEAVNTVVVVQ
jgi:hypothetical protein